MGPLRPLFWTSDDVCPRFQASIDPLPTCFIAHVKQFLRFTSGVTSGDLAVSMAAKLFDSHTCTCVLSLVRFEPGMAQAVQCTMC